MNGIVIITATGEAKRDFVNALFEETGGAVELAIVQRTRRKNFRARMMSFYKKVGIKNFLPEIYCFLALKFSPRKKKALTWISTRSPISNTRGKYLPPIWQTEDINSDEVYERLRQICPQLIVIWGGYVVQQRILETAKYAINMHFGICPYYRGVNGIHHAILNDDIEHMGVTIHYAVSRVDAGGIITLIKADSRKSPEYFFRELNDKATKEYVEIAKRILNGEKPPPERQDLTRGKNYLLREWTYRHEYALAKKILAWQKSVS